MSSFLFKMPEAAGVTISGYENPNIAHPYVSTPEWNFGANAEARALNDIFNDAVTSDVVWQPDVYHEARKYAAAVQAVRVIDIGCGNALKLKSLFSKDVSEVIALDFAGSLLAARENYPDATHVECDLTSWNEVLKVAELLESNVPTVVICADVIEHIADPRPLLALIRILLSFSSSNRGFISTPDRSRLDYPSLSAKPANPAHIREWTTSELRNLLMASGFNVIRTGNIRATQHDEKKTTTLIECSFDKDIYDKTIARCGIATGGALQSVMLTTEYPQLIASGGIGTFVADWHRSTPSSAVLTSFEFTPSDTISSDTVISPSSVIDLTRIGNIGDPDVLLLSVIHLIFLCPDIREIHYQDYLGIGFRIAQAKSAGILPDRVNIIAHCHGNQHYLENANQMWLGGETASISVKEKISIELADFVVFPSKFLQNFYAQSGISTEAERTLVVPYRYSDVSAENLSFDNVKNIVFIGKFLPMKGFDLFCSSFDDAFCKELQAKGVERLVFIGRGPEAGFENEQIIKSHFDLAVYTNFAHAELINFIRKNRSDSLFVEPYRGDNFPLAVFDVVANGGLLVAGNAGGIPEMFRSPCWQECLMDLTVDAIKHRIRECVDWSSQKKEQVVKTLMSDILESNKIVFDSVIPNVETVSKKMLSATVMVPFYNTDIAEVVELFRALNHQTLPPSEVIIVNDASSYKNREELAVVAETYLSLPYRIIDHAKNLGLAAARNTALAACNTDLILNVDSDDIPLNDWVKTIVIAMSRNPDAGAAVPYLRAFEAGTDFNRYAQQGQYIYRAVGDGYIHSQAQNCLGHANSGYSVASARRVGGWDASNKAKYEDWAFYLNLLANGIPISVIPATTCLYRVRRNSMVRTYAEWPGQRRLFQMTAGLSRFEALQLQRLTRTLHESSQRSGELEQRVRELKWRLNALENRKILKMTDAVADKLRPIPIVFPLVKGVALLGWRSARFLRRLTRS